MLSGSENSGEMCGSPFINPTSLGRRKLDHLVLSK